MSTMPESLVRRSREAASVSCTDARGGGTARPSRWFMRRFMPTLLTRSVGRAAAAAARAVTPARSGSSTSQLNTQNTATTAAVATQNCPRQRDSSATRTRRGSPARRVSGRNAASFRGVLTRLE